MTSTSPTLDSSWAKKTTLKDTALPLGANMLKPCLCGFLCLLPARPEGAASVGTAAVAAAAAAPSASAGPGAAGAASSQLPAAGC